jgi:hypothetical protein
MWDVVWRVIDDKGTKDRQLQLHLTPLLMPADDARVQCCMKTCATFSSHERISHLFFSTIQLAHIGSDGVICVYTASPSARIRCMHFHVRFFPRSCQSISFTYYTRGFKRSSLSRTKRLERRTGHGIERRRITKIFWKILASAP